MDEQDVIATGDFNVKRYDFIETSLMTEPHENYDDVVEQKIFKYKYRQCNDSEETFNRRNDRMVDRFRERAKTRDSRLETDLAELYIQDMKDLSVA